MTMYTKMALFLLGLGIVSQASSAFATTPSLQTQAEKASLHAQIATVSHSIPSVPYKVILNQQNARVFAESTLKVTMLHGQKLVTLPLPAGASDVNIVMPNKDARLVAMQQEKAAPFAPQGSLEKQRVTFESMADSLNGALNALYAQYNAIYEPIIKLPPAEAQAAMEKALPEIALLGTRIASTERELKLAKDRASSFSQGTSMSQKFVLSVDTDIAEGELLRVGYSYTLQDSNWRPVYVINADSEAQNINFKLVAKIVQNSDLDWTDTEVEFSTAQGNEQNPPAVAPWIVQKRENMQARAYNSEAAPMMMMAKNESADIALGGFDPNKAVASWSLNRKLTIPEGETSLVLQEEVFTTPLERIARPSSYNGTKVWLSAKQKLTSDFLPIGEANYLLDGVPVGQGTLEVKNNAMTFYFGIDPLVTVETKKDIRKSDEAGIISKDQIWTWGWTYTVHNKRNEAVSVRLEEPETQLSDKAMSVIYADSPAAQKGEDDTLIWNLSVPAKGQSVVKRIVTVTAPKDMQVYTGR